MTESHLATYERSGRAAIRGHLCAEHYVAVLDGLGMSPIDVPDERLAEVHRLLTDERSYFPEEEPA